jgi:hypothetical protein
LFCPALGHAAQNLSMSTVPVFIGMMDGDCYPILIKLENKGPDARGEVQINQNGVLLHYPVELPRGTTKGFIAYPVSQSTPESMHIDLLTDQGDVKQIFVNPIGFFDGRQILVIGDNSGDAVFLKTDSNGNEKAIQDIYGKPDLLPERGSGYGRIYAVILGSGAERMSDSAVRALKDYVIAGGKLIFCGGADPSVARDPRWRDLCPVYDIETRTLTDARLRLPNLDATVREPATEGVGLLSEGAAYLNGHSTGRGEDVQIAYRPAGAGTVYYLGLDPFDAPLNKDMGSRSAGTLRGNLIKNILNVSHAGDYRVQLELSSYSVDPRFEGYPVSYAPAATRGGAYSMPPNVAPVGEDVFSSVSLPSGTTVGLILLAYIIVVAPLNLLILRKLGRSEWAWATAPIISLAFAVVFFKFAGNLYAATLSKKLTATVVADQSLGDGFIFGSSQLFFPRGDLYNLKLENTELVESGNPEDMGYGMMPAPDAIDAVDDGTVQVPALHSTNLAFHELNFAERTSGPWPKGSLHLAGSHLTGTLRNETKSELEGANIYANGYVFALGNISPGQTLRLDEIGHEVTGQADNGQIPGGNYAMLENVASGLSSNRFVLTANLSKFEAGPRIEGKESIPAVQLIENLGVIRL